MGSEQELKRPGSAFVMVLARMIRSLGAYITIRRRILQAINACEKGVG